MNDFSEADIAHLSDELWEAIRAMPPAPNPLEARLGESSGIMSKVEGPFEPVGKTGIRLTGRALSNELLGGNPAERKIERQAFVSIPGLGDPSTYRLTEDGRVVFGSGPPLETLFHAMELGLRVTLQHDGRTVTFEKCPDG